MIRAVGTCVLLLVLLVAAAPAIAQVIVADRVSEDASEGASQPKLGRDASGGIHLTYVKPAGGYDQIFVASSADGGGSWRNTQVTRRAAPSRYPTLAVEPDGTLHLAWTTYEPIGHVYYARWSGGRWSAPLKISPGDAYAGVPAIAVDPARTAHVVWYGIRNQAPQVTTRHGSIYEIMYTGLVSGRWSSAVVISPGIPDSINPALAAGDDGTLHSAWYQFDIRAYQVRYARRTRAWEQPHQVTTGTADAFAVALALGPRGRVYVVWERRGEGAIRVYFAERGDRWSAPAPLSGPGEAQTPAIAADGRGRLFVVWDRDGQLELRRRDGRWLGVERLAADGANHHPILAARGDAVDLMWTQTAGGRSELRFATLAGGPGGARRGGSEVGLLVLFLIGVLLLWQLRRRQRLARP